MLQLPGRFPVRTLSLCVALALHGMAQAQAANDTNALPAVKVEGKSSKEKSYTVEESSTATPLGLALKDTPQSVSVITQQRIADQNLQTITDVVNNVTGLSVHQYETSRAQFTARGYDINNLMIDGAPTTWDQAWSGGEIFSSLALYDRVEVVRGSTGLVTGAGDPSAAINLIRKQATARSLTATGELEIGRWDKRRAMVDLSTALNADKTLRGRVVAEYADGKSETRYLESKRKTIYGTVAYDITPDTVASVGVSYQESNPRGSMWGGLPVWYTDGSRTSLSRSATTASDWTGYDTSYTNYFANLEHRFSNGWKLKASYSRGERKSDSYLSYVSGVPSKTDGTGMSYFNGSYLTHTDQDDATVQANGPFQLFGRTHEASLGLSYQRQKFLSQSRAGDFGLTGDFNNWNGLTEPTWGALSFYSQAQTKQEAVFGAVRLNLADSVKLILGGRITNYERDYRDTGLSSLLKVRSEKTPYAGLTFDLTKEITAYASYTDIFRPQSSRGADGMVLDPVKGKTTEAGLKGAFLGGKLTTSAAVFHARQDNLAQATGSYFDGTTEQIYEAADTTSMGFELEMNGELAPGWTGTVGYSQFRLKAQDGSDANSIYPRKQLRVYTTYRLPMLPLTVGGGVNWESESYTTAANPAGNAERITQGAFALVNVMARYEISKNLSAQINVNNVGDKTYFRMFDAFNQFTYGEGRAYSATLRYTY